jgi:hypothetical protein
MGLIGAVARRSGMTRGAIGVEMYLGKEFSMKVRCCIAAIEPR